MPRDYCLKISITICALLWLCCLYTSSDTHSHIPSAKLKISSVDAVDPSRKIEQKTLNSMEKRYKKGAISTAEFIKGLLVCLYKLKFTISVAYPSQRAYHFCLYICCLMLIKSSMCDELSIATIKHTISSTSVHKVSYNGNNNKNNNNDNNGNSQSKSNSSSNPWTCHKTLLFAALLYTHLGTYCFVLFAGVFSFMFLRILTNQTNFVVIVWEWDVRICVRCCMSVLPSGCVSQWCVYATKARYVACVIREEAVLDLHYYFISSGSLFHIQNVRRTN